MLKSCCLTLLPVPFPAFLGFVKPFNAIYGGKRIVKEPDCVVILEEVVHFYSERLNAVALTVCDKDLAFGELTDVLLVITPTLMILPGGRHDYQEINGVQ
jgi:hypothetical protein